MPGAVHGTTDAAVNASAVAVEQRAGRPILNGCHAAWSLSAVHASVTTAALAHICVSLAVHLVVAGAVLLAAGLMLGPRLPDTGRTWSRDRVPDAYDSALRGAGAVTLSECRSIWSR